MDLNDLKAAVFVYELFRVYLSVHQRVVEQYEPVVGEAPGVLQRQRSAAALAHHATLRETQDLLMNTHTHTHILS